MGRAELKVPGGKMMVAETEVEAGLIIRVKITGDFFMHPEEAIEELESALTNLPTAKIEAAVEEFFGRGAVEIIGASPGDFTRVLVMSLGASSS